jgi:isopenicillin N synthase-like dioxygenase
MQATTRTIPVVDLSQFSEGTTEQRNDFVQELGQAFHEVGFVGVNNHGISKDLVERFYASAKDFFSLPIDTKRGYELAGGGGQLGYTSFGKEHAKHSNVPDLKEFFQIGQFLDKDKLTESNTNIAVKEIPAFFEVGKELYQAFEQSGARLLEAIALYLNLDVNYFNDWLSQGDSILRAIHYPPITQEPASAIRAEQHEDINLITLLVGASAGGLQLLNAQNEWLDITPEEDEIVINVGDMLQRLTNNYLKSTTHRVVNPPKESWHVPRMSIPFFLHPRGEMSLDCLENCVSENRPIAYEAITAGDYLNERLREIGMKK